MRNDGLVSSVGAILGTASGAVVAPLFALTSFLRHARTFHPRGDVYAATVSVDGPSPALAGVAERLAGRALVRFSGALWKHGEALDVLGCAVRFRDRDSASTERLPDDQDLLFATIRRPWTMPLAPLLTNAHDYLGNDYFAVSPFEVEGVGRRFFRLRPERASAVAGRRRDRLDAATLRGSARLHLECSTNAWASWQPIVRIDLTRLLPVDDAALRFDPFAAGRGIRPVGYVQSLRRAVYDLSQRARPTSSGG